MGRSQWLRAVERERAGAAADLGLRVRAVESLRTLLQSTALPRTRLSAPLYVLYGGADRFNAPEWITAGIRKACELGGPITITYNPAAGHGNVDTSGIARYLADRVAGLPVRDDCRR